MKFLEEWENNEEIKKVPVDELVQEIEEKEKMAKGTNSFQFHRFIFSFAFNR